MAIYLTFDPKAADTALFLQPSFMLFLMTSYLYLIVLMFAGLTY